MPERLESCAKCGVDVSVPAAVEDARCPRCQGPLETTEGAGSRPDRTIVNWRPTAAPDATAGNETATWRGAPSESSEPRAVPVPRPPLAAGTRFGPYVLDGVLGKGGMGVVYRAHQPTLQRWVALKVLTTPSLDEEDRRRFLNEARAAARLAHPNIVSVHDVGSVDDRDYFTMDLVEGMTLHEAARRRLLRPEDSYEIVRKVALAVDHAHKEGIIHRDLKPGNILLQGAAEPEPGLPPRFEPRVTDFGLAKDLSQPLGLTLSGVALGSPPYMPPEQARGAMREVDHLSDVYALGAVLYECLTGEPPFTGASLYEIVARIQSEEPVSPRRRNPGVSIDAETIVLRCLEKEKWRRYPSAGALARDLERHLKGEPIHAVRTALSTRLARRFERHLAQIVSIVLMTAIIVLLASYLVATKNAAPEKPRAAPARPEDRAGAVDEAARQLERPDPAQALEALARGLEPEDAPRWSDLRARAAKLDAPLRAALEASFERRAPASGSAEESAPASGERLADVLADLDTALDASGVAKAASVLYAPRSSSGAAVAERAAEVARVRRALREPSRERVLAAAAPAFAGRQAGPLDAALASVLLVRLAGREAPRPDDVAALASAAPRLAAVAPALPLAPLPARTASGALERRDATGLVFRFPPVALGAETARPRAALLAPGAPGWLLAPTLPVRALDGRRLFVGWLRFLYALDDHGRILARRRLPGRAASLARAPDGALVVECDVSIDGLSGPRLRVLSRATGGSTAELETLETEDGRSVSPLALDVAAPFAAVFEMRELAAVTSDDMTNPWVRAARARSAADAADALSDPALTPPERVALACRVFAAGWRGEAEEAWHDALDELVALHGYVPELAGYGEGDCGLSLATAVEAARAPDARAELAAWRDAFAPALASPHETAAGHRGAPSGRPDFTPARMAPPPPRGAVPKGIGGLDGRWLERLSIVLRFQREFGAVALAVAFIAALRWHRQQRRDLAKVGAKTAWARWLLYLKAPGLRIGFALPTYVSAGDKLAFLFLYVAYLGAFAVQDAALKACTEIRRAPPAILVGLPEHPSARRTIEEAVREGSPHAAALLDRRAGATERLRARDEVVLGAEHWWSHLPRQLAELSFRIDSRASVAEFRAAYPDSSAADDRDLDFLERVRNGFFWVIPSTIVLFVVALLVPARRPFEPGPEDLRPPLSTRLLSLAVPGASQFVTGRPVRGVLLLAPFLLVGQAVFNQLVLGKAFLLSVFDPFFRGDVQPLAARLVAESRASLARVHHENGLVLLAILLAFYAVHWADLAVTRRRALRLAARSTRGRAGPQVQESGST